MEHIPSKQLFWTFPEKTGEESRLKNSFKINLFVGDDFANQKGYTKGEEERNEIFQDKSGDRFHIQERAKMVALYKGNRGGKPHTCS